MQRPALLPPIDPADLEVTPVTRSDTIPSGWYTDAAFHNVDRDAVFARTWQNVGAVDQVKEAGQFIVGRVADNPVIVVRGQEGELRAFYNVCKHRGGPLALCDGQAKSLRCQYHGWTYLLDGSLRGVPKMDRSELFDKKDFGLVPIAVDTWEGQVFVHLGKDPKPVAEHFDGITERIAPISIAGLKLAKRVDYEVACNWKVYVDNFLEGYHVPFVHPELVSLFEFSQYRTEVFKNYNLQRTPLDPATKSPYSGNGDGGGQAFYYWVWPNFMLNILPGRLQTNVVEPLGHDRCRVVFRYFLPSVGDAAAVAKLEADHEYSDKIQEEDREICEQVQQGLGSRAYDKGRFSPEMEEGVWHFQSLIKGAYGALAKGR
ncbi:MAG TPA: aromatic ring-hydroxylating dioxygenase subunit alpha [Gemmatimonadales bacterium]|nr:aromatic ring-hydroxylating dioxygenase subunit alpha [Gemmatimonadales bacterium]